MDKYQNVLLETEKTSVFFTCTSKKNSLVLNGGFNYDEDVYTLIQEEDIFSTKYEFIVNTNPNIETCTVLVNGEWQSASRKGASFSVELDFENRVEKVKLTFADNIVDDYIFSVHYVEADKELYYQKQKAVRKANMLKSAHIKHLIGTDLVNIYFQPCCVEYSKTVIELWVAKGEYDGGSKCITPRYRSTLKKGTAEQIIANFIIDDGVYFKSINGLANGFYCYRLRQYANDGEILFESDFYFFEIKPQNTGGPIGRINRI